MNSKSFVIIRMYRKVMEYAAAFIIVQKYNTIVLYNIRIRFSLKNSKYNITQVMQ